MPANKYAKYTRKEIEELISFFKHQRNRADLNLDILATLLKSGQYKEDVE